MQQLPDFPRRQARVLASQVILPSDIAFHRWYEVRQGRRHDDTRPGMVLLDLGTRLVHFPARCLEFRTVSAGQQPAAAPVRRTARRALRITRRAAIAVAASALPIGIAAVYAVNRMAGFRHLGS